MTSQSEPNFERVGRRVARRVGLVRWVAGLERTAVFVCGALVAAAAIAFVLGRDFPWPYVASGVLVAWPLVVAVWCARRRPRADAALAIWDETAGRAEMFVTAWWLERARAPTRFERLHLRLASSRIDGELARLKSDFPLPRVRRAVVLPAIACLIVAVMSIRQAPAEEERLTQDALARAVAAADRLAERPKLPEQVERALDEEQRDRFKQLQQDLDETADKLRKLEDDSARDILDELERRAFDADRLSESLGGDPDDKLSSAMLAELERHADTSEMAAGLRGDDLERAADEAGKLADRLAKDDLTLEERRRIEQAMSMSLKAGNEHDRKTTVGKALDEAEKELKKQNKGLASKKLRELAENLRHKGLRKKARKQLQQLARQLRESGPKILGRKSDGLQTLARNDSDLRPLSGDPQSGDNSAGDDGAQSMIERLSQMEGMPQTGEGGRGSRMVKARPAKPGEKPDAVMLSRAKPSGTGPKFRIPIPGSLPGDMAGEGMPGGAGGAPIPGGAGAGDLAGAGAGQFPIPGSGAGAGMGAGATGGGQGAGIGGREAGRGSAPYTPSNAPLHATTQTGAVSGRPGGEGPSQFRATDLAERPEEISRQAHDFAVQFLKVEEASLDEELLPLNRREQVLRYFTAIRRRLAEPQANAPRP